MMTRTWIESGARFIRGLAGRLARARDGGVAMIFAISMPVLILITVGGVDIHHAASARVNLQDSLDAATLAAARSKYTDDARISQVGMAALRANLAAYPNITLREDQTTFHLNSDATVIANARVDVKTLVANIFLPPYGQVMDDTLPVGAHSEVVRSSKNIEVAMVLDITGSMSGSRISDLRDAANDLVDLVVQDVQTPYYTKVALVPYSMGVNAGAYANAARGAITGPAAISNIAWRTGSGRHAKCLEDDCELVVTANNHGLSTGERVWISGVNGMRDLNNRLFTVKRLTANTYVLKDTDGSDYDSYSSGGSSYCTRYGCEYFVFTDARGDRTMHQISSCVSERTGTYAYSDAAPSGRPVGLNYPAGSSGGNACISDTITPLNSDRDTLHGLIDDYEATGSTAGQIGIAWGWYMVSPDFGSMFSGTGRPGAYHQADLLKVVVIMTDGEFNTPYCQGVIAKDAGSGSGNTGDHINCNATNGSPFTQSAEMCEAMKSAGVIVYTVGFDISGGRDYTPDTVDTAKEVMQTCATDADHVYLPNTGADLKDAFAAIGRDIANLRISK